MHSNSPDPVQKSLQIGQEDKFYCKLLSKESSAANPSFRVYYGGASGAVPFRWESLPGTPKHPSMATALPPLTPPPSYQFTPRGARTARRCSSAASRSSLLNSILPRLTQRKPRAPSSPPGSLSSSVSSSASSFSPMGSSNYRGRSRSRFSSPRSSFSSMPDDDESDAGSPTSTLCFGQRHCGFRRWYKMVVVKNALLSIVGRGSGQGTAA
ncbi:hypothetical protein Taro_011506 [Colocasia esculenta]|uniref:Uncharacterized protein n=1 Tax=Colocasia esculenta TaxID=4460 RepID=A0A843UA63_COLES|nr:hypothetical protein [Colocasia esculenta]